MCACSSAAGSARSESRRMMWTHAHIGGSQTPARCRVGCVPGGRRGGPRLADLTGTARASAVPRPVRGVGRWPVGIRGPRSVRCRGRAAVLLRSNPRWRPNASRRGGGSRCRRSVDGGSRQGLGHGSMAAFRSRSAATGSATVSALLPDAVSLSKVTMSTVSARVSRRYPVASVISRPAPPTSSRLRRKFPT